MLPVYPPAIYIKDTGTAKGRGAFAGRAFVAGETVESCPVVLLDGLGSDLPETLRHLLFDWGVLTDVGITACLALGYGSLYNHDNPAAMRYEADPDAGVLRFVAVRDIQAGEELTVNYNARGGGPVAKKDTWFAGMGVQRLEE